MKINEFKKVKPKDGQHVIWVWYLAGQVFVGDYFKGKVRLAFNDYRPQGDNELKPTYWIRDSEFWGMFRYV